MEKAVLSMKTQHISCPQSPGWGGQATRPLSPCYCGQGLPHCPTHDTCSLGPLRAAELNWEEPGGWGDLWVPTCLHALGWAPEQASSSLGFPHLRSQPASCDQTLRKAALLSFCSQEVSSCHRWEKGQQVTELDPSQ